MGVLIGFYGNWLIQLLDKLKSANTSSKILLILSFGPLFVYFWIAYTDVTYQLLFNLINVKGFFGFLHFVLVITSTGLGNILVDEFVFILPGVFFWLSLLIVEMKGLLR